MQFQFAREADGSFHFKKGHPDLSAAMVKEAFYHPVQDGMAKEGLRYRIGLAQFGERIKIIYDWVEEDVKVYVVTAYEYYGP